MKNKILIVYGIPLFLFVILILIIRRVQFNDEKYLIEKDFCLSGIVYSKENLGHNIGPVIIRLTKSNYKDYHPRSDNRKRYFCKIYNGKAKLILGSLNNIELNDSIIVDNLKFSVYRNKKLLFNDNIGIPIDLPLFGKLFD